MDTREPEKPKIQALLSDIKHLNSSHSPSNQIESLLAGLSELADSLEQRLESLIVLPERAEEVKNLDNPPNLDLFQHETQAAFPEKVQQDWSILQEEIRYWRHQLEICLPLLETDQETLAHVPEQMQAWLKNLENWLEQALAGIK